MTSEDGRREEQPAVVRLPDLLAQIHNRAEQTVDHNVNAGAARLAAWIGRQRTELAKSASRRDAPPADTSAPTPEHQAARRRQLQHCHDSAPAGSRRTHALLVAALDDYDVPPEEDPFLLEVDDLDDELDDDYADDDYGDDDLALDLYDEPVLLIWPREEFEEVDRRWPEVLEPIGCISWDDYRRYYQALITRWIERRLPPLLLVTGTAEGFAEWLIESRADPLAVDLVAMADAYGHFLAERGGMELPPADTDSCWCGSGVSYAECCRQLYRPLTTRSGQGR